MKYLLILIILLIPINIYASDYFIMTSTGYTNHRVCIGEKWFDGKTAMNTPIQKGVVAINVDKINNRWIIKSPLKLGQKIYIEGIGIFRVEDTGSFTEHNYHFDFWNVDIYFDTLKEAKEWGKRLVKVYIIGG